MDKIWIVPICFIIVGYFGIFWTFNLGDMELTINLNTDNNTLEVMKSMERTMKLTNNITSNNVGRNCTYYNPINILQEDKE